MSSPLVDRFFQLVDQFYLRLEVCSFVFTVSVVLIALVYKRGRGGNPSARDIFTDALTISVVLPLLALAGALWYDVEEPSKQVDKILLTLAYLYAAYSLAVAVFSPRDETKP